MSFWYLAPVVSAFVRLKKENSKFEDSLIYSQVPGYSKLHDKTWPQKLNTKRKNKSFLFL